MTTPAPRPLLFKAPCDRCLTVATLWPFQDRQALCPACHPDHTTYCDQAAPERLRAAPAWVCPHHITYRREEGAP